MSNFGEDCKHGAKIYSFLERAFFMHSHSRDAAPLESMKHKKKRDLRRWDLSRPQRDLRGSRNFTVRHGRKKALSRIVKNSSVVQKKETSFRGGSDEAESSKGGVPIKLLSKYLHRCTRRVASERLVVSFPEKRFASRPPGGNRQEIICEHPPHGWWGHTGGRLPSDLTGRQHRRRFQISISQWLSIHPGDVET